MNSNRPLKPDWMLKPGPWKTLHDKGVKAYLEEMKDLKEKAKIAADKKRKDRMDYLFKIYHEQCYRDMMWPYDLAKRMGSSEETLQFCREVDHLYKYDREYPQHEYDPQNYLPQETYDYPDYDEFYDFENDPANDLYDEDFIMDVKNKKFDDDDCIMDVKNPNFDMFSRSVVNTYYDSKKK